MNRALTLILVACLAVSSVAFNAAADETKDIPDNAAATGVHDALVAALSHADLVETLQGDGPFTVFAPTDEAFAAAGINLDDYDNDSANETLADILLYHVVAGAVDAANVTGGMVAAMVNGDNATFTVDNGTVMINDANVTTADVNAIVDQQPWHTRMHGQRLTRLPWQPLNLALLQCLFRHASAATISDPEVGQGCGEEGRLLSTLLSARWQGLQR